jgi:TusA-related sulfurtransferase
VGDVQREKGGWREYCPRPWMSGRRYFTKIKPGRLMKVKVDMISAEEYI